jgi:glutaredoxin-related protein
MPRPFLEEAHIHPDVREAIANHQSDILREVRAAVTQHPVVVIGMRMNPMCKKARRLLDAESIPYTYLEYGSYLSEWRRRNALKMWTGWPTFPMVFVRGTLVGGADDLQRLMGRGEFARMVS